MPDEVGSGSLAARFHGERDQRLKLLTSSRPKALGGEWVILSRTTDKLRVHFRNSAELGDQISELGETQSSAPRNSREIPAKFRKKLVKFDRNFAKF